MTTGTWIVGLLTLISGIALLAAVIRTWYWKRGRGNGLRTRVVLFVIAVATSLASTVVSFCLPARPQLFMWALTPALIAGVAALLAMFHDKAQTDRLNRQILDDAAQSSE